ncbi:thioesterase family protein [Barrientosiimonas marina]
MDVKPRVAETDMLGHINNATYFVYMEEARLTFLGELGIQVGNGDFSLVLVSAKCDFIRQGFYGNVITIDTTVTKIGRTSVTLISQMFDKASGHLIAKGQATIVYFDIEQQKSAELPDSFKAKLQAKLASS